jgi:hypothetical protein
MDMEMHEPRGHNELPADDAANLGAGRAWLAEFTSDTSRNRQRYILNRRFSYEIGVCFVA